MVLQIDRVLRPMLMVLAIEVLAAVGLVTGESAVVVVLAALAGAWASAHAR